MAIVKRLVKGQALTALEHDTNLTELDEKPNGQVYPKTSSVGIKIDNASPDWGWNDLMSDITLTGDLTDPSYVTYIGTIKQLQFDIGDRININFHLPHDYALGTDLFIHIHWSHNSPTVVSGAVSGFFEASYAKGHNQAAFSTPVVVPLNNIPVSTIRYQHIITEGQLSAAGGAGGLLVTEDLEPDGLILCALEMTANTINDGSMPFVHKVDIHYQTNGLATKNKVPDFYT